MYKNLLKKKKNPKRQTLSASFGALSEQWSKLLNNLRRALWKLNNSPQCYEMYSQLGVPLVDSLLDSSTAWQTGRRACLCEVGGGIIPSSLCLLQLHQPQANRKENRAPSAHFASDRLPSAAPTRDSRSVWENLREPQRWTFKKTIMCSEYLTAICHMSYTGAERIDLIIVHWQGCTGKTTTPV